jgi:hypothetical protein
MAEIEKPLCHTCRFRVLDFDGGKFWIFDGCYQKGRGWRKDCPQYEREPGSDDE